jgi:uncharacterized protein YjcR
VIKFSSKKNEALHMYVQGFLVKDIAEKLELSEDEVWQWVEEHESSLYKKEGSNS